MPADQAEKSAAQQSAPAARSVRGRPGRSSCRNSLHTCGTATQPFLYSCQVAAQAGSSRFPPTWPAQAAPPGGDGASRAHAPLLPSPSALAAVCSPHRRNLASGSLLSSLGGSWWPQEACAACRRRRCVPARRAPPGEATRPACAPPMMLRWRCRALLAVPGPVSCAHMGPHAKTCRARCPQRLCGYPGHRWWWECRMGMVCAPQQEATQHIRPAPADLPASSAGEAAARCRGEGGSGGWASLEQSSGGRPAPSDSPGRLLQRWWSCQPLLRPPRGPDHAPIISQCSRRAPAAADPPGRLKPQRRQPPAAAASRAAVAHRSRSLRAGSHAVAGGRLCVHCRLSVRVRQDKQLPINASHQCKASLSCLEPWPQQPFPALPLLAQI